MRRFAEILLVALGALAALPANAQDCYQFIPVDPCVAGTVKRVTAQGQTPFGVNFNVKVCYDGPGFCYSTTTDAFGHYQMLMPHAQVGRYWFYAWNDTSNWGSSTQAATPVSVHVDGCDPADGCPTNTVNFSSAPRPTAPGLVAPVANSKIPNNQLVTFQWTPESDPLRLSPNWPIVYDVFKATNGGIETPVASNIVCCSKQVAANVIAPAGGSVSWRAVAKMNTKVLPADPYYQTSSSKFNFTISPPDDFSITASPSSTTMNAGTSKQLAISTTIVSGVAQTINLSTSGLPVGVTASFSPNPIAAGASSTMTLNADGSAPNATATFDVIGTGAVVTRTAAPRPTLTVVANSFSLSISPSSQPVDAGQSVTYAVSTGLVSGLAQVISLAVNPKFPTGLSGAPNPSAVAAGQSSTLVVSASSTMAAGTYPFTVLGTAASGAVSSTGILIVNPPRSTPIPVPRPRRLVSIPPRAPAGSSFSATVEMDLAAPAGGLTVSLQSSNTGVATVPASVTVAAGATVSAPFTVTTLSVSTSTPVTITATLGSSATASFYVDPAPTVSVAWIKPAEVTFGPAGTLTVAGYAQNGTGGVTMYWQDATAGSGWNAVAYVATPDATNVWYNTIPTSNNCHTYQVYATYSGATSSVFGYNGLSAGYCHEAARVIWMQPQALAGFGPPGSIVLAGSATGAPAGTLIQVWTRDVTAGAGFSYLGASPPDGSGIWYQAIQSANSSHVYAAYVTWDAVTSATCSYAGNNVQNWCP